MALDLGTEYAGIGAPREALCPASGSVTSGVPTCVRHPRSLTPRISCTRGRVSPLFPVAWCPSEALRRLAARRERHEATQRSGTRREHPGLHDRDESAIGLRDEREVRHGVAVHQDQVGQGTLGHDAEPAWVRVPRPRQGQQLGVD